MSMKTAAIFARVSSDQQKEDKTIASMIGSSRTRASAARRWFVPAWSACATWSPKARSRRCWLLSPDRLSRKYAYQVLLTEEWLRQGVETIFVNAPQSHSPEDQLLLQFQGMIAEYERAQILERSRRGKRHRAKQGEASVLSAAPYGYRYVRKTDDRAAYFEVIEAQAAVVRQVYDLYTVQALSIGAITRRLNELGVPTRKEQSCWERSTVWGMLRNPAYRGTACFGKTQESARQRRSSRAVRMRVRPPRRRARTQRETPRDQWIQIAVPALVDERTSTWPKSDCRTTSGSPHAAPSSRASCRAWCIAQAAATPCTARPPTAARARSTTTAAWVPTPGATRDRRAAAHAPSVRICSRTPSGARSRDCSRTRC
jgi:site-specific DNA recombinase